MSDELASCVVCGAQSPTRSMELTGHGLRCVRCTSEAEIRALEHGAGDMSDHLTPQELEDTIRKANQEILSGIGIFAVSLVLLIIFLFARAKILIYSSGGIFAGAGLAAHGMSKRKQAQRALKRFPGARVVQGADDSQ